jgi:hypothetical protein
MTNQPPAEEEPVERQPAPEPAASAGAGPDLLTIGLLVFFVSLLVTVAALLALPTIVG